MYLSELPPLVALRTQMQDAVVTHKLEFGGDNKAMQYNSVFSYRCSYELSYEYSTVHEKNKNQQGLHSTYLNHPYVFKCFQTNDCNCNLQHFQVLQTSFFCFPYLVQ